MAHHRYFQLRTPKSVLAFFWVVLSLIALVVVARPAKAAPEAHILRIDPRTAQQDGAPVLTTVIELVENRRVSDVTLPCASLTGNSQLSCMSDALDRTPLYSAFPFPGQNAVFTVRVDGSDVLAKYLSQARWGESQQLPGIGTAWLIIIDADARMGKSFDEARELASRFIASMGPNDIVNITFINDRMVAADSKWLPASQRSRASSFVQSFASTVRSQGRNRSLFSIIRTAATDAFKSLGNVDQQSVPVPLHQAMVVLSTGYGGADALTTGPGALQLQKYMTDGRFPEDNTALPKSPVPVISVYFPASTLDEYRTSAFEFMQNLANPEIGGYFTIMQNGQQARAQTIVNAVRTRFSKMYIVKWRVSCVNRSVTQTFQLNFHNVKPPIIGDNSFKDVPVGIDPTTWPLDIDTQVTQESAKRQGGVYPGGRFKVYGSFCWGGDVQRAEVYFLPVGQQLPTAMAGADIDKAKKAQQQLIEMGMRGKSLEATDSFVEFEAPDKEKILHGSGDQAVVRLVVYDNQAKRTSGVTADTILELKGTTAPFPLIPVLGGALGLVLVALLLLLLLRGGSKRSVMPPPAPIVAGVSPGPVGLGSGSPAAMAPVAPAVNPEFMYGSPAPVVPPTPPMVGYGATPSNVQRATLQGSAGVFTVVSGADVRVGRDGGSCEILLGESRVSAVHATLSLKDGQLLVRDENSNNGTTVNGQKIPAGAWFPVPNGSLLRFGPVELSVRLE